MNGIINILKPTGMTSHDVVSFVRRTLKIKKVGHAGTLDPNVSGVLPICVGKATKFSDILINGDKEYICEMILGSSTDTQDQYGNITNSSKNIIYSYDDLEKVVNSFKGIIYQRPPAYSAVKLNGKKLYEYARENIVVQKEARPVNIKNIQILRVDNNKVYLKIKCSKGTYMRTICNDIGEKLGTYAHMGALVRTNAKGLKIEDSITLEELQLYNSMGLASKFLIPVDNIVPMEKVYVTDELYDKLLTGNDIYINLNETLDEKFYVYCRKQLLGIGHKTGYNKIKIDKMLI